MPVIGLSIFEMARSPTKAALKAAGLEPEPEDRMDTIIVPAAEGVRSKLMQSRGTAQ